MVARKFEEKFLKTEGNEEEGEWDKYEALYLISLPPFSIPSLSGISL